MYLISKLSGKIYKNTNGVFTEIVQDSALVEWQEMNQWQANGGVFEDFDGTEEEVQKHLNSVKIEAIKNKYEFHKQNGWKAYQDFRAKVVLDIQEQKITEVEAFTIESFLKVAYDRIAQNGDWKTAYYELSQVTGFPEFVQEYYDLAIGYIQNYILTNYEN